MATWRELIDAALSEADDGPLIACTLTPDELDAQFDNGWGGAEGKPFTGWTERRVYFPAVYDGAEWCASAPRWPSDEATEHVGGG